MKRGSKKPGPKASGPEVPDLMAIFVKDEY